MDWIARGLGLFYLLGGLAVIQGARRNWLLDRGLAAISLKPTPRIERIAGIWFFAAGATTTLSGVLLMLLSRWAVVAFLAFWLAQVAYLIWVWRAEADEVLSLRRGVNALALWTLATLFVLWIDGAGRLS